MRENTFWEWGHRPALQKVSDVSFSWPLQSKVFDAQTLNDSIAEEKNQYAKLLEEERETCLQNKARVTVQYFVLPVRTPAVSSDPMMQNCFFDRLKNWRSQMRSCSSAKRSSRKLSLRCKALQNLPQNDMAFVVWASFYQQCLFSTDYSPPGRGQDPRRCPKRSTQMSGKGLCSTKRRK